MTQPSHDDHAPRLLWAWDAETPAGDGARGVTRARDDARRELLAALDGMPAQSQGVIRAARLDTFASPEPGYAYGAVTLSAYRDDTGKTVVRSGPRPAKP
ncbi:hypothetical protein Sme01_02530 [Sphaerisporangium melleum]|uniref:Uncharacterized protein n=1 Tax=Sphaerisporangium melleum TaxID=321316 RepID=A0A917QPQ1_9ACTN|nr:hypothetical protein [Sphaerisporangium melleum]GGK60971.1 hypothetical protein GCM10007964_00070 [Sphaerisporangium melleum]GII67777.1 hypothetical protein Sme01_02530 [Sphaerisporangium melleum]